MLWDELRWIFLSNCNALLLESNLLFMTMDLLESISDTITKRSYLISVQNLSDFQLI